MANKVTLNYSFGFREKEKYRWMWIYSNQASIHS